MSNVQALARLRPDAIRVPGCGMFAASRPTAEYAISVSDTAPAIDLPHSHRERRRGVTALERATAQPALAFWRRMRTDSPPGSRLAFALIEASTLGEGSSTELRHCIGTVAIGVAISRKRARRRPSRYLELRPAETLRVGAAVAGHCRDWGGRPAAFRRDTHPQDPSRLRGAKRSCAGTSCCTPGS